jgi:alkanesulfonate monooxygenase SsuD/methylene tetrahydromethanopterin reductase-like flavin-dependent oxidoreductase (luciferase family)
MLRLYRATFRPSAAFAEPRAMLAVSAICAETDAEAEVIAGSVDLTWLRIEQGRRELLPSVADAQAYQATPAERERMRANRARHFVGSPSTLRERLTRLTEHAGVDELMVLSMVHDHQARRRSYQLLATAFPPR